MAVNFARPSLQDTEGPCLKPSLSAQISNLTNELRLHQFLRTRTTEATKSLKTDANGAH